MYSHITEKIVFKPISTFIASLFENFKNILNSLEACYIF